MYEALKDGMYCTVRFDVTRSSNTINTRKESSDNTRQPFEGLDLFRYANGLHISLLVFENRQVERLMARRFTSTYCEEGYEYF